MDCFRLRQGFGGQVASLAMTWKHACPFPRLVSPESCNFIVPQETEGAGNAGCALHPRSRVPKECAFGAHEHTGEAEAFRHPLRNGFTAYSVLSSATNSFLSPSPANWRLRRTGWLDLTSADLTPATGARTTRLHRPHQHRSSHVPLDRSRGSTRPATIQHARRCRVHRIPSQRSVTMADAPPRG